MDDFENNLLNNLMEHWVLPEIHRRQESCSLKKPFTLQMAQIIFEIDSEIPVVRLNQEVKGRMLVRTSETLEAPVEKGDPVLFEQIGGIEVFELEDEDSDHGHATLIRFPDKWYISFNFIYNKTSSREHLAAANEFLQASKFSLNQENIRASIDNLHSASELAAKAYLLGRPDNSLMAVKSHGIIQRKINQERKMGNVESAHIDVFNKLSNQRASARYFQKEITVDVEELRIMYQCVEEFIGNVSKQSEKKL